MRAKRVTQEEEADQLGKLMVASEKGELSYLVAEVDGKMIGQSTIRKRSRWWGHVGVVGIMIKRTRYIGIGKRWFKHN